LLTNRGASPAAEHEHLNLSFLLYDPIWRTKRPLFHEDQVHACGAPPYALRIEYGGKVIAYSGDTEWSENLIDAVRETDLFVCEAYFFDKRIKYHLDYRTLLDQRERLGCRRLVLTHMSEDMLRRVRDLEVEYAEDGRIIEL
jgi:ribonuclease BN (tRNA processing enzyme)